MVNLNHSLSRKSQPKNRERHPNSPQLDARTRKEEGGVYVAYARDSTLIFRFLELYLDNFHSLDV